MLVVYFLFSLLIFNSKCEIKIPFEDQLNNPNLIKCITNAVRAYLSEDKGFTYVGMNSDDNELLKEIHSTSVASLVNRQASSPSLVKHIGYLITAKTVTSFTESIENLPKDIWWKPSARFLIVIDALEENELRKVFDALLKRRVINVLVVNGTDHAHLYTYNPFDNYACGRYYTDVISYGLCSQTTENLFPNKLVTGLRNCTFNAAVQHQPPFSVNLTKITKNDRRVIGTEQYIFQLLGETEQFEVNYSFYYDSRYTTVSSDMKVVGPMAMLKNNETDVMFGNILLVSSRMEAFTYLHGYMDSVDQLLFFVKRASFVPDWKNVYLEFSPLVWLLLLLVFLVYSTIIIKLVRADDKTEIMLMLLQNLVCHGCNIPGYRPTVKCVFIIWVWFAYLMSSLYQTSLVSLTTRPIKEFQVSSELELVKHKLQPCINTALLTYIYSETNRTSRIINFGGLNPIKNMKMVGESQKNMFTLYEYLLYKYNKKTFCDEYGISPLYYFKRPYANFIYAMYFYKGFPLSNRICENTIRFKENGLVDKSLNDHYYSKKIKSHFRDKDFESRFTIPWGIYVLGCILAIITFIAELLSKYYDNPHMK